MKFTVVMLYGSRFDVKVAVDVDNEEGSSEESEPSRYQGDEAPFVRLMYLPPLVRAEVLMQPSG
jgi:hypothetical protein